MKTSQKGIDLIKAFEGLSLTAIRLAGESYYTIGYGHYGKEVKPGQRITSEQAETLLKADLEKFEEWVNTIPEFTPNQNQFDALVSFTYNLGPGNLQKLCKGRTAQQVAEHMTAYINSGSDIFREGLLRRRKMEQELFLTPYEEEDEMIRYERLKDIPEGFRDIVEMLMNAGIIAGDGSDPTGNNDRIDLSHDQVRSLIFEYRGGAFDRKLMQMGMKPVVEV